MFESKPEKVAGGRTKQNNDALLKFYSPPKITTAIH
jgi:hypothetical protein